MSIEGSEPVVERGSIGYLAQSSLSYAAGLRSVFIGLVGAGCYLNSLGNGFVFDDIAYVGHPVLSEFRWREIWGHSWLDLDLFRPLTLTSIALDLWLYGQDPWGFHFSNVLLHATNCVVFCWFARTVLANDRAVLFASLWYAVHPLQTDVVDWVASRGDLLVGLCVLSGLICHLSGAFGRRWLAYVLCAIGLLAKETAVVLPLLACWSDKCGQQSRACSTLVFLYRWLRLHGGYLLVFVVIGGWRLLVLGQGVGVGPDSANFLAALPVWERLINAVAILPRYLILLVCPMRLSADYSAFSFPVAHTLFDPWFLGGVGAVGGLAYLIRQERHRLLRFAGGWASISLLPVANLFFLAPSAMAERYLYLTLPVVALVFGWVAGGTNLRRNLPCVLILLLLAVRTVQRNVDWHSDQSLFTAVLRYYPNNARAHENLGAWLHRAGRLREAEFHYQAAVVIAPDRLRPYYNLGLVYTGLKSYEAAERQFDAALHIQPDYLPATYGVAIVYQKKGQLQAAERGYRTVLSRQPSHFGAAYNLGRALEELGRWEEAGDQFENCIEIRPESLKVRYRLGEVYHKLGHRSEMGRVWRELLRRQPEHGQAGRIRQLLAEFGHE